MFHVVGRHQHGGMRGERCDGKVDYCVGTITSESLDGAMMQLELRILKPNLVHRETMEQTPTESGSVRITALYPKYRAEGVYSPGSRTLTYKVMCRDDE